MRTLLVCATTPEIARYIGHVHDRNGTTNPSILGCRRAPPVRLRTLRSLELVVCLEKPQQLIVGLREEALGPGVKEPAVGRNANLVYRCRIGSAIRIEVVRNNLRGRKVLERIRLHPRVPFPEPPKDS